MTEMTVLGDTLDELVNLLFATNPETAKRAEFLIREMLWDNKVGIIRKLQERTAHAPSESQETER